MSTIALHKRLGFRLGLLLFVGLFVVDLALIPLWNWLYFTLTPEWSDPATLRAYAAELESMSPAELEKEIWDISFIESSDYATVTAWTVAYAAVFAVLLGGLASFVATRRIRRLTREAGTPGGDDPAVPGPFHAAGDDEIAHLGRTMNEMRARILSLLGKIDERDRLRREWVAEVSHDLRTPITALGVALEQAHAVANECAPPRREALVELIESATLDVRRIHDLAVDLLEIGRLEAGDPLNVEPVPAGELVRNTVHSLMPVARERRIELQLDLPVGLPELCVDGRRLMRAIENVVLNSIQHAIERVHVTAGVQDPRFVVRVSDDGPGLPKADGAAVPVAGLRHHLRRDDSTGIGLEVAAKVVAAHGGRLLAENRPGAGATFEMILPYAPPESGAGG